MVHAAVPPADLPPRPNPARFVNDLAGVLSVEQRTALERKLQAYNDSTSTQIAVVLLKSVGNYEVADFAQQLGEAWGVGQNGQNNGLVILAAVDQRRVAIETGYGMEARVPDYVTALIIREQFQHNFKQGRYYEGLDQGIDVIIHRAAGAFSPTRARPPSWSEQPWWVWVVLPGLALGMLLMGWVMYKLSRQGGWGGRSGSQSRSTLSSSSSSSSSSGSSASSFGGGSFGGGGSSGGW